MATHSQTGSFDLSALNNLNQNLTQYFWFEEGGSGSYPWGLGAHVTLYPQSDFTDPNDSNYLKGQNILINTDGFSLRNGTIPLMTLDNDSLDFNLITNLSQGTYVNTATFGTSGVRIGLDEDTHVNVDYRSIQLIDRNGNAYLYVRDLRDASGVVQVVDTFRGGEEGYWLTYDATSTDYTVTVSDGSGGNVVKYNDRFIFNNETNPDATITAEYETESDEAKAYTIGMRVNEDDDVGGSSFVIGTKCVASGAYSHAEGWRTTASAVVSYAEGYQTLASGGVSHAEGINTTAEGINSHAQNLGTYAATKSQTVIGEYNEIDDGGSTASRGNYALIIGNGTSDSARSNALTVDWLGGVNIYLDHNGTSSSDATSGTDKDLFNAIRALGWYSDVIV